MTGRLARAAAFGIAVAGVIDPACETRSSERPTLSVEIIETPSLALPSDGFATRRHEAEQARERLAARLADRYEVVNGPASTAAARVVIGDAPPRHMWTGDLGRNRDGARGAMTHAVTVQAPPSPNARIVAADSAPTVTLWDTAEIAATIEGRGLAGQEVVVRLMDDGVELASTKHRWLADVETFDARLTFVPSSVGARRLQVEAFSGADERTELDNRASLVVSVTTTKRRVLVYQPRPSWMAEFVRRSLQQDPRVEVSSRARVSRDVEVTTPGPHTFDRFDAVVVGAPDVLTAAEVQALKEYATTRGGAVVLLADAKTSGPSLTLMPAPTFDEVLLEKPVELLSGLRASELSVARSVRSGWDVLASEGKRPVLLSTPRGRGHLVFSGALDAWRFREGSRYWQDLVAAFAAKTPPPLRVRVEPRIVGPGEDVEIAVEIAPRAHESPPQAAQFGAETIRLWPGGEPGLFRGAARAPARAGLLTVAVEHGGARAEAPLVVDAAAVQPWAERTAALEAYATATGGRVVSSTDLEPLIAALAGEASSVPVATTLRPMRSALWILPFVSLLGIEWTLRRRRHLH